jgi:hypothetical protein
MTTEPLTEPRMRERLQRLRAELETAPLPRRPGASGDEDDDDEAPDLEPTGPQPDPGERQ